MSETVEAEQVRQMDTMLRSHLERCLQDVWQSHDLECDRDGDYPYRHGTAACWVSLHGEPQPGVMVLAFAVTDIRRSARLLAEVNELNGRSRWARVYWDADTVAVEAQIPWTAVNRPTLALYTQTVGSVADEIGSMLAVVYGGATPFDAEDGATADAGDQEDVA